MSVSLPLNSKFSLKKELPCREETYFFAPAGGDKTYSPGDPIVFRPSFDKSKLRCIYGHQSYIYFEVIFSFNALGGPIYLDSSSNCFFNRILVTGNGGVLQDFNKSNVYLPCVYDLTCSRSTRSLFFSFFGNSIDSQSVAYTVSAAGVVSQTTMTPVANAFNTNNLQTAINNMAINNNHIRRGLPIFNTNVNATPAIIAGTISKQFAAVIPSFFGAFAQRIFPISELAGSNFDLEIYTDTQQNAIVDPGVSMATGAFLSSYVMDKLRLVLSVVEYSELITETIRRSYNNTFTIPCVSMQTFTQNLTTGSQSIQNFTWPITATLKNAKGILFTFRSSNIVSQQQQYSLSSRSSMGITNAQLVIGPYTFPKNRQLMYEASGTITSGIPHPNYFMSAMKYFGQNVDCRSNCSTDYTNFNYATNTYTYVYPTNLPNPGSTFVLAFNLEGLHENDAEFRSCISLDGNSTVINLITGIATSTVATDTMIADCFVMYEFDVVISNGTAVAINKYTGFDNIDAK